MAEAYSDKKDAPVEAVQCKQRYEQLKVEREPYLRRARECAELTLPYIMPPEGHTGATELATPFQSAGAEGVNSLASSLLLALLPPNASFFRLKMDDAEKEKLAAESEGSDDDILGEIEKALGKIEQSVLNRLEQVGARASEFEAEKHLIVCGNVLVQILKDGAARLHFLDRYVCKRDPSGNVLELIVHESIAKIALPPQARALCEQHTPDQPEEKERSTVDVYTRIVREAAQFKVYQEIYGTMVPGSEGTYPFDKSPWIPRRWTKIDGQDYGRGRVEEYLGDFQSLESLSQSLIEGTAISAKTTFLVNEAGVTKKKDIADSPNGAIIDGDIKDVGILKIDKYADFRVGREQAKDLEQRLKQAFMVFEQRDAERVTAEEIRTVIEQLEKRLGGVYAVQSQEHQLPFVIRVMHQMQTANDIPRLPKSVAIKIITGLDALGRGADFDKLRIFVADVGREFGPEAVAEYINVGAYMERLATALQIDLGNILRSEDDVQKARQQRQQAEMVAKLGPPMIKSGTDQALAQQAQPAAPAQ